MDPKSSTEEGCVAFLLSTHGPVVCIKILEHDESVFPQVLAAGGPARKCFPPGIDAFREQAIYFIVIYSSTLAGETQSNTYATFPKYCSESKLSKTASRPCQLMYYVLCICVFMYLCIYVFMYLCISVLCIMFYVFMYLCIYVFMYLCIYVLCIMCLCIMSYVVCVMYYVLCVMYYVLHRMYYVLCLMYNV